MKRTLFTSLALLFCLAAFAQSGPGYGLKAGLNFNSNGDLRFDQVPTLNSDTKVGYHLGVWGKFGDQIYLRPELIYTKTKSEYNGDGFDMQKIDLPVLVGLKLIGPLHAFAGPAFQYILDTELDGFSLGDVENDFTVGLQLGAGLNLGKFGVDLRYERGLGSNEVAFVGLGDGRLDTRPSQFILSLSLKL